MLCSGCALTSVHDAVLGISNITVLHVASPLTVFEERENH